MDGFGIILPYNGDTVKVYRHPAGVMLIANESESGIVVFFDLAWQMYINIPTKYQGEVEGNTEHFYVSFSS